MEDFKATNPKDILGNNRIELGLISEGAIAEEALAMTEGLLKYGRFNYRIAGVKVSVYISAARRHLAKYWNGEDRDPITDVHHLGSARACLNVIFDALAMGVLKDDRPPRNPGIIRCLDEMEPRVARLREMYGDRNPRHYGIGDVPESGEGEDEGGECCQVAGCEHAQREAERVQGPTGFKRGVPF